MASIDQALLSVIVFLLITMLWFAKHGASQSRSAWAAIFTVLLQVWTLWLVPLVINVVSGQFVCTLTLHGSRRVPCSFIQLAGEQFQFILIIHTMSFGIFLVIGYAACWAAIALGQLVEANRRHDDGTSGNRDS